CATGFGGSWTRFDYW
nr:immunoglobulin heavy chain junction region [Macaca mulatta]MOX59311.1 immunoglobulin heavy chain junction region [Macaca mulatta]MOX62265.1 immunoglobulin heavy chain junction region [Macaca mulatta]MOX62461.1 immunoglobulin heavy chain junction region [Macaca mulatta]MOX62473.1 immunoglobulin heavy chain junction region [Macaca mulatta]